ncbi:MAG TPA: zf-HC2 domain-containing protein [Gemmataceae bacterium]|nr:zf-HC2 domain-containing protein [Gemmataceae bacterium]
MMTCRELIQLLIDFVSGELPPEHQALVQQHLQTCPPCVAYLQTYQHTIRLARQLPCQPLPPDLDRRLRAALAEIKAMPAPPAVT